jgi:hypothetical protein
MSPESFTNVLLITLISLITTIGGVGYKKITELINKVTALLLAHNNHKNEMTNIKEDILDHKVRIDYLEKNKVDKM